MRFLCYRCRGRWLDICRSGTTATARQRTGWRSTCARTSSRRDTSWTTTAAALTGTSGSTARRVEATWKSCLVPAERTRAGADASGWRDGSCSTGGRGPCPIIAAGRMTASTPLTNERALPPRLRRKSHQGRPSVFRCVCVCVLWNFSVKCCPPDSNLCVFRCTPRLYAFMNVNIVTQCESALRFISGCMKPHSEGGGVLRIVIRRVKLAPHLQNRFYSNCAYLHTFCDQHFIFKFQILKFIKYR